MEIKNSLPVGGVKPVEEKQGAMNSINRNISDIKPKDSVRITTTADTEVPEKKSWLSNFVVEKVSKNEDGSTSHQMDATPMLGFFFGPATTHESDSKAEIAIKAYAKGVGSGAATGVLSGGAWGLLLSSPPIGIAIGAIAGIFIGANVVRSTFQQKPLPNPESKVEIRGASVGLGAYNGESFSNSDPKIKE